MDNLIEKTGQFIQMKWAALWYFCIFFGIGNWL